MSSRFPQQLRLEGMLVGPGPPGARPTAPVALADDRDTVKHAVLVGYGQAEATSTGRLMVPVLACHKGVSVAKRDRHDG
jgi:hypothetical protein